MKKLTTAFACYLLLGLGASLSLDGNLRVFLWIFLGALALKTWIGYLQSR